MTQQKHMPIRRSLSLFRRLQVGPTGRDVLMDHVEIDVDPGFYSETDVTRARKRLEKDLARLRELGIEYEYDRKDDEYRLLDVGDFNPISLTGEELQTLAFLAKTFKFDAPRGPQVQNLMDRILAFLPQGQRAAYQHQHRQLVVDLQQRDSIPTDRVVLDTLHKALHEGRLLRFDYASPGQEDGLPRRHTVEPWRVVFDTTRGHIYLDAFWLQAEGPKGAWKPNHWQLFRTNRILSRNLEVLPDKRGPVAPKRPRHTLDYLLSPEIARWGQVTRHFADMQVHQADADGWVRVTATTDDLFRAVRLLLSYGPNCKVIGGKEAKQEMEKLVAGLVEVYGVNGKR